MQSQHHLPPQQVNQQPPAGVMLQAAPTFGGGGAVQFIVQTQVGSPTPAANFKDKQAMFIGVAQIVVGVLCVVFNAVMIAHGEMFSIIGYGIWGGVLVSGVAVVEFEKNANVHLNKIGNNN